MTNQFYRAFEDRYRGSRDVIKQRLSKYLPFLQAIRVHYPDAAAIDLGCGRGEWLEVLGEQGLSAHGVDLDEGMLAAARERGLDVREQDVVVALAGLPDQSMAIVSAFHLVEHIPFNTLRRLVAEALRVLVPGGLLILETPNPENIVVGCSDFYTDPSHLRPIPPSLLAFVAEYAGYTRCAVVRLQEDPHLHDDVPVSLLAVLSGASPDYSIVAQKNADGVLLAGFDPLFSASYGVDMKSLALRHESQSAQRHAEIHHILAALADRISADRASTSAEHLGTSQSVADLGSAQGELGAAMNDVIARLGHVDTQIQQLHRQAQADLPVREALTERLATLEQHADVMRRQEFLARIEQLEQHADVMRRLEFLARIEQLEQHADVMRRLEFLARIEQLEQHADAMQRSDLPARTEQLERHAETFNASDLAVHRDEFDQIRAQLQQTTLELEARLAQSQHLVQAQSERIEVMLQSRSWRITAPLRLLGSAARQLRGSSPGQPNGAAQLATSLLHRMVRAVLGRPRLKRAALALLAHMPGVRTRLRGMLYRPDPLHQAPQAPPPPEPLPMGEVPSRVARIYRELKQAQQTRND